MQCLIYIYSHICKEHFCCADCGLRMRLPESVEDNTTVFQKNGELYCETDYKRNFVPRCAFCSGFIMKVRQCLLVKE